MSATSRTKARALSSTSSRLPTARCGSKDGALQSYSSRSFYLPVPEAKEIISRRVDFLRAKVKAPTDAAKAYFSRRGFQVRVNDLAMLAEAVGKVFVDNDYVSGLLGPIG
jgi:hypothetical protein